MIRFRVTHRTQYKYESPVSQCQNVAHLRPRATAGQSCEHTGLRIEPPPAVMHHREDIFGNQVSYFSIQEPHLAMEVSAESLVCLTPRDDLALPSSPAWEDVRESLAAAGDPESIVYRPLLLDSPHIPRSTELAEYARASFPAGQPLLTAVRGLVSRIHAEFAFDAETTTVSTPVADVLKLRRGVCQDFAHLTIGCLRSLGLAARYVSGYLETLPPPGQPRLVGADASHAWLAVYCPGVGWIDFDPTNDQVPHDRHITVAWGRDYSDVTPLKGVILGGGKHTLEVSVDVQRQT